MSHLVRIFAIISLTLLVLSYPACQWGERIVKTEMAKYPPEFVAQHEFDMIFLQWVLPGIMMFFLGLAFAMATLVLWFVKRLYRSGK